MILRMMVSVADQDIEHHATKGFLDLSDISGEGAGDLEQVVIVERGCPEVGVHEPDVVYTICECFIQ